RAMEVTCGVSERTTPQTVPIVRPTTIRPTMSRTETPDTKTCSAGAVLETRPNATSISSRTATTGAASRTPVTKTTPSTWRIEPASDVLNPPPPTGNP